MSFLTGKSTPPPPPPPPPPEPDLGKAKAMAEEAEVERKKRRKGTSSTIVAGALGEKADVSTKKPTLMS